MSYFNYRGKTLYYEELGSGSPLLLLHGNTLSSKMFTPILDLYSTDYQVILIDFLGHGASERVSQFEVDFWFNQAEQIKALVDFKGYKKLNLLGTSGGALAAINFALEYPTYVEKVIADSFDGENANVSTVTTLRDGREMAKKISGAVDFWKFNHGEDWEVVVDCDTTMLEHHAHTLARYFHKDLSTLSVPILFTASQSDSIVPHAPQVAAHLSQKAPVGKLHLFENGQHPAIISQHKAFSTVAKEFLEG